MPKPCWQTFPHSRTNHPPSPKCKTFYVSLIPRTTHPAGRRSASIHPTAWVCGSNDSTVVAPPFPFSSPSPPSQDQNMHLLTHKLASSSITKEEGERKAEKKSCLQFCQTSKMETNGPFWGALLTTKLAKKCGSVSLFVLPS